MTKLFNLIDTDKQPNLKPYHCQHLINGQWQESENKETFNRYSPSHQLLASTSAKGSQQEAEAAIVAARKAFDSEQWSVISGQQRANYLLKIADLIDENRERIAQYEVFETGKPISQARSEIEGAAGIWRYAASLIRTLSGQSYNTLGSDMLGVVLKEPIGVVSIITPWNFPFLIASQKVPFALAAGCTCVLKPSELSPTTATILGELAIQAELPNGVLNIVHGYGDPVGTVLSEHSLVDMVSFTGSTKVGKLIAAKASTSLKKVSSELGGKNPQVICHDANLDSAADAIAFGVFFNAGECCNSGSRILVHEDIADELIEKVIKLSKTVTWGNPFDEKTKVGAIISEHHQSVVDNYVKSAVSEGAKVLLGGDTIKIDGLEGIFYQPTIISDVTKNMKIAKEEVFGPVLSVIRFSNMTEALDIVNDSTYGLSAGIWSDNIHTCLAFARKAQAGTIWTNTWMDGYPELPFGGYKESGQGRELGTYGLDEFLEVKTVQMRIGNTRQKWV